MCLHCGRRLGVAAIGEDPITEVDGAADCPAATAGAGRPADGVCPARIVAQSNPATIRIGMRRVRGVFMASLKTLGRPLVAKDGFDHVWLSNRQARAERYWRGRHRSYAR